MVGICALHVCVDSLEGSKNRANFQKKADLGDFPYFRISRLHLEIQESTTMLFTEETHNTLYQKQVKLAKQVPSYYSLPSYHIKTLCNYKRHNSDTILYPEPFLFIIIYSVLPLSTG